MARNEEKALTLFNKWQTFKKDFHSGVSTQRPFIAQECESLPEAEKWRRELVRDITRKIASIHNASLGEHRIRELNDEINKMMRQKHHWEMRIRELGGSDFKGKQVYDVEGKELPGAPGYKYYGAAKELPGVRELFAEQEEFEEQRRKRRTRGDMYKNLTPDYYGYRDDDDGILVPKEKIVEERLVKGKVAEFEEKKRKLRQEIRRSGGIYGVKELSELVDEGDEEERNFFLSVHVTKLNSQSEDDGTTEKSVVSGKAYIPVPSQTDIDATLIQRKKEALIEKFLL